MTKRAAPPSPCYSPPVRITTERLTLRPLEPGDAPAIARHANDRDVWLNLLDRFPRPYRPEHAEKWIAMQAELAGESLNWAIDVEGEAVGVVGLQFKTDVYRRTAVIGYWLGRDFWGRGLTSEAVRLIADHTLAELEIDRLEAEVFEWNVASARVLEKAGFDLESRRRKSILKNGQLIDALIYVRFRPDLMSTPGGGPLR